MFALAWCESLVEEGLWPVVPEKSEVRLIELVEFPPCLDGHRAEPVRLPAARREVPLRGGELHHVVHPQKSKQVLGVLLRRFQVAHKVVLNLARMAKAINLPPVLIKGHVLLRLRVQEVLDEVGKRGLDAQGEGLIYRGRRRRLVGVAPQHDLCEAPVEVLVAHLEFVPIGGDETYKRVPHEQELGVLLQLHLQKAIQTDWISFHQRNYCKKTRPRILCYSLAKENLDGQSKSKIISRFIVFKAGWSFITIL